MTDYLEANEQKQTNTSHPIGTSTSEEMVAFVVLIISTLLQRRIENTQTQLEKLKLLNIDELSVLWIQLNKSAPQADALHIFTNWIEGKLDGDGLSC